MAKPHKCRVCGEDYYGQEHECEQVKEMPPPDLIESLWRDYDAS